jgi:hypothetical protein
MASKLFHFRGKGVLLTEWFQTGRSGDLLDQLDMPYRNRDIWYSVCDIWNDSPWENPKGKIDLFMRSNQDGQVTGNPRGGAKKCESYPGSRLFTGVALDKTHAFIVAPGLTSTMIWNNWFVKNLERNPEWRPQMESPVPVGVVLIDFAKPKIIKRMLDVGFRMANIHETIDVPESQSGCW